MRKINKTPLHENRINATVLYTWTRESNPRCKFLPGNRVKIKRTGQHGKVIAVSTVDGVRIKNNSLIPGAGQYRNAPRRGWAAYYVQSRGNVYRFDSSALTFAPYYQTA